ncbi:hypothetical protein ACFQI7_20275 [Paenibacillus allorhizosphaerae]|uniref:Tyrosine protein kinase n=1 Tax=Paenibacillus allorhizosphaerae TaxID=2849866 RepID=A0ABM8VKT7_9BACL|nr:hypothetical protein [Paenibacillus allorhizosphaerae]CAG7647512.1 hypothetical protein PAECIP111802_03992 [Paenibacillus allorhizosphaerae]
MSKIKQSKPGAFTPSDAMNRGRSKVYYPPANKGREAAAASTKGKRNGGMTRKPRIAKPRYDLNNVEVQGLFSAFGGGGGGGAAATGGAAAGGDFFSLFKKVGGLDGIISTMSKVQKMYTLFQQMGPIFKLMGGFGGMGSLLGGAQVKTASVKSGSGNRSMRRKPKR